MRQRGIFLKIYLWFWFATTLVVATEVSLHNLFLSPPGAGPPRHPMEAAASIYGRAAVECYAREGPAALAAFADQTRDSTGMNFFIVNHENAELSGRPMPPNLESLAARALRTGREEHLPPESGDASASPLIGADGKQYVVVGQGSRIPFPPFVDGPRSLLAFRIVAILFISGLVCYWLALYVTRPVLKLREATRRFADGELAVRVGEEMGRRRDEFSDLFNDFDRMAERIESLLMLQRQLLSDISHELRSPLARLNVAAELARQHCGPDAEKALNRIEREAELLNVMIGQLLTLTRLESGIGAMEVGPVDLATLLKQIAADADFEARGSGRSVRLIAAVACSVSGKGELLRSAVENVVRNAIRYTKEGTSVEIELRQTVEDSVPHAQITVRDHGPGVPESELPHLFRPFYRVSDSRERKTGGTGLGLAIAERAVKLHRGIVKAANAPDGGLIVVLSIPLPQRA